jgi:S-formylglutathione hydrolase FrmB
MVFHCFAGKADTISIQSMAMHRSIKCVVIKPNGYNKKKNVYPVVYLLHGYGGSYNNWIIRVPDLKIYSDEYQAIIVCPDGNISSWYFDSPIDSSYRYETYIATEVVHFIDAHYKTIADKDHRAITGLSMGGHGALFLALHHPEIFGAAGSMSGGVDLKESNNRYDIAKRIGDTITHAKEWHDMTVINLIENYINTPLSIIFDCGNKDIFVDGNRRLHQKMLMLKIPHTFIERPGEHNWDYWKSAVPYQLLYFKNFFNRI